MAGTVSRAGREKHRCASRWYPPAARVRPGAGRKGGSSTRRSTYAQDRLLDEPKTSAGKRTIVDRDLADDFAAHLAHRGLTATDGDSPLFVNRGGRPLIYSSWRLRVWLPALRQVGLAERRGGRYLGFHDLRSVNASIMVAQGVGPKTAQVRFGHTRYTTTAGVYARSTPRRNRQASEKIHAVLRRSSRDGEGTSAENSG